MEADVSYADHGASLSTGPARTGRLPRSDTDMILPLEMFRDVCDMLYEDCDLRTLSVLSQTCRFLNDITIPIIYSKIGIQFSCWTETSSERVVIKNPPPDNPTPGTVTRAISLFPVFDPPLCHYSMLYKTRRQDTLALQKLFGSPGQGYAHHVRSLTVNIWCLKRCQTPGLGPGPTCFAELVDKTHVWIKMMDRLGMFRWGLQRPEHATQARGAHNIPLKILKELNDPSRADSPITQLCLEGTATKDLASLLPKTSVNDHGEDNTELGPLFKALRYISMSMDAFYEGMDRVLQACQRTMRHMIVTPDAQFAWYDNDGRLRMTSMDPGHLFGGPRKLDMQYLDLTGFSNMKADMLRKGLNLAALRTLIIISDNDETPRECVMDLIGNPLMGQTELPNVVNLQYEGPPLKQGWEKVVFLPKLKRLDAELFDVDLDIFMNIWEHGVSPTNRPPAQDDSYDPSSSSADEDLYDASGGHYHRNRCEQAELAIAPPPAGSNEGGDSVERVYYKPKIGRLILAFHEHADNERQKPINLQRERVYRRRRFAQQLADYGVRWVGIRERLVRLSLPPEPRGEESELDDLMQNPRRLGPDPYYLARIDELNDDGTPVNEADLELDDLTREALGRYRDYIAGSEHIAEISIMYRTKFHLIAPPGGRVRMVDPKEEHCTCIL